LPFARTISAADAQACVEPERIIAGGVRDVPGKTMFKRMRYLEAHADDLPKLMLQVLRGNPASNFNLIHPPMHP